MKYYREIELKNFEIIQEKSLIFINKLLETSLHMVVGHHKLRRKDILLQEIPELQDAFNAYNLTIATVAYYISTKPSINYLPADQPLKNPAHTIKNPIHVDNYIHQSRINIPILNTKGTFTRFFTNCCVSKPWLNPFTNSTFSLITNTDYIEVDAVELLKTTVLRVNEPHLVHIPEGIKLPRITLTIGFDRDPVYLLED
jgi:hypothetical protein